MNRYFHQIKPTISFNLKRFLKNKTWIIMTSICTGIIVILYILFAILYQKGDSIALPMITTLPNVVALIYLGTISALIINQLFIQDKVAGIQGLEKRMGRSASSIFWTKFFVQKIFVYAWILLDYCLFLLFVPTIASFDGTMMMWMSVGVFALFIFDWLFTGIIYLVSLSKSTKVTVSISGVLLTILVFFPLIGPAFRLFSDDELAQQIDVPLFHYKNVGWEIQEEYQDGILAHFNKDLEEIYLNEKGEIFSYTWAFPQDGNSAFNFFDQGLVALNDMQRVIGNSKFDKEKIKTNDANFEYWKNSFTNSFFEIIDTYSNLNQGRFEDSWFSNNTYTNYSGSDQLKNFISIIHTQKFLDKLNEKTNSDFKIGELDKIVSLVEDSFFNYYLTRSPNRSGGSSNGVGLLATLNNKEVSSAAKVNEGQRLFTRIIMRSASFADLQKSNNSVYNYDLEEMNKAFNIFSRAKTTAKLIFDPFNALIVGSVYAGPNSFKHDVKIANAYNQEGFDFLKPLPIRQIKVEYSITHDGSFDQVTHIKESKKLLSIGWLYGFYLILQIIMVGITYLVWYLKDKKKPLKQKENSK